MTTPVSIVPFQRPEHTQEARSSDWLRAFVFAGNLHAQDATGQPAHSGTEEQVVQSLVGTSELTTKVYAAITGDAPKTLPLWAHDEQQDNALTDERYPLGFLEVSLPQVSNRDAVDADLVLDAELSPHPGQDPNKIDPLAFTAYEQLLHQLTAVTKESGRRWARVWKLLPTDDSYQPYAEDELYRRCGYQQVFEELCGKLPASSSTIPLPKGFSIFSFSDDHFPEGSLPGICRMRDQFLADVPLGTMATSFEPWTPERLITAAREDLAQGIQKVTTLLLRGGAVRGFSTLTRQTNGLENSAGQGATVLSPEVRGQGLAIILKTHAMAAALERWPHLDEVHTAFDPGNTAIRRTNEHLGFVATHRQVVWQADCS